MDISLRLHDTSAQSNNQITVALSSWLHRLHQTHSLQCPVVDGSQQLKNHNTRYKNNNGTFATSTKPRTKQSKYQNWYMHVSEFLTNQGTVHHFTECCSWSTQNTWYLDPQIEIFIPSVDLSERLRTISLFSTTKPLVFAWSACNRSINLNVASVQCNTRTKLTFQGGSFSALHIFLWSCLWLYTQHRKFLHQFSLFLCTCSFLSCGWSERYEFSYINCRLAGKMLTWHSGKKNRWKKSKIFWS